LIETIETDFRVIETNPGVIESNHLMIETFSRTTHFPPTANQYLHSSVASSSHYVARNGHIKPAKAGQRSKEESVDCRLHHVTVFLKMSDSGLEPQLRTDISTMFQHSFSKAESVGKKAEISFLSFDRRPCDAPWQW